jgi:EAL domain-containing protein (putative c-di-GMP-specific phosphodiesterase class I)
MTAPVDTLGDTSVVLDTLLRRPDVPPGRVVLEITEHRAVTQYDDLRRALLPHRSRGLRMAVDDVGAG